MTDLIHAPWSTEQVQALNDFQQRGGMHPFTCGAIHASGRSPVLDATHSGWICPDPECTYTQDWAWAFMTQPTPAAARQAGGQQPDDADALCGHCGVPKSSHHHPWTSTDDAIANAPWNAPEHPAAGPDDTQTGTDRERVRLAIARQWLDETGSGRTVDDLDDAEFGTLADAVLAALGKTTTPAVEEDETR
ncbi:hypothetical protein ACWDXD_19905 [Streptomyces sp. NPDC003314]